MTVTVKILKRSADGRPTLYATRDVEVLPISIGRDAACTIKLEDPNKHMSRFHVEIEEESGVYWMSVVSKVNPVMVKGRRYGPGTRLTLKSGDSFELAEYEVQVLLPEPTPEEADPPADEAERMFNESTFFGEEQAPHPPSPAPAEPPPEETFIPPTAAKPLAAAAAPPPSHALRAFFEGAGLPHKDLTPMQADRLLRDCGAILRAAVDGLMMLLLARGEMRKEFEAEERTMVAARDNNPLKLMSDPHEAMDYLFDPAERTDGFLDPVQAVGDACEDLRSHEIALMAGMRAAILGVLGRFDPPAIERAFDKGEKGFSLASRKARLWDAFVAHQDKLAREAQEDFNKVFGREFMAAYQAQLRRLKGGI
ncbi:MAG TPA: type VI secretion system-associated FHA domain protein TagH [Burkholderiales bacterium]|jgi:predicted component of type VI protein secretion system